MRYKNLDRTFFVLSQFAHLSDGLTDGRTDRHFARG